MNQVISHIISSSGTGAATLSSVTVELGSDEESGATTLVSMDATVQETWFQEDHAIIDNISLIQDPVRRRRRIYICKDCKDELTAFS